jgi:hypothetical protein
MHIVVTTVVLLSACYWLPHALINSDMNIWLRIAAAIVGILGFVQLFERDMYLPFLADASFPTSLLVPSKPTTFIPGNVVVSIAKIPPNAKVVYWAAEPNDPRNINKKNWKDAYGDYENAGVVMSNDKGMATINLRCPQTYSVSHFGVYDCIMPPHIHYRYELPGTKGILSQVYMYLVDCGLRPA